MSNLTIKTNNHFRPILHGFELTEKERKEYDWMDWSEEGDAHSDNFFRYKGWCYYLGDFMKTGTHSPFPEKWHGYLNDSFFSGILVRLSDDGEGVVVGTYYS